jgi:hypothetical protein
MHIESRHLDLNQGPLEYHNFLAKVCFGDNLHHYNPLLYQLSYSKECPSRESNPRLLLGRQQCYHYTTRAKKMGC